MNIRIRRSLIQAGLLSVLLPLCIAASISETRAASFDCAKATTKIEKMICDNPVISKLDDELNAVYKTVLDKANEKEKQDIITQQRHWLKHTRNVCETEVCFKHAYWSRQSELAFFFQPKSPLYKQEADKADEIRKVLETVTLYLQDGTSSRLFCSQMFADLKEMKGIRFVDPIIQTMSYEDPALDTWKKQLVSRQ